MKIVAYIVLLLASQAVPPLAFGWIGNALYGSHSISAATGDLLTSVALLIGASGLVIGAAGIHWTLRRIRPWIARTVTAVLWMPLTLSAATYLYALLVFRSWA